MTKPPATALYNHSSLNDADFVANFTARRDMLDALIRRLKVADESGLGHHNILIGPRGMGKTTLLRRLAIAITETPDLSSRYIPLGFREEQYNVLTLDDFWRNCGEALAEWGEANAKNDLADRLDRELANETWANGLRAGEQFRKEMQQLNRRAVLLVDNLDLILNALPSEDKWALRRFLQANNGPIIIGAAAHYLEDNADRDAAFYEFFQPHHLEPLNEHETEYCMRSLAARRGPHGLHVLEVLDTQPERLKTLHVLTGGNPRILTLIYRLLEVNETEAAMADLEVLLDQVTPYYKSRVEEYQTPQQRAVIDAIALHWDPVTTGELSKKTRIASTTLSPLLARLRKDGFIEQTQTSGSYAGHQIVERFLNIWYLMRHGTRRTKQKMRWLVSFLTNFYSSSDLNKLANRTVSSGYTERLSPDFEFALNEAIRSCALPIHEDEQHARTSPRLGLGPDGVETTDTARTIDDEDFSDAVNLIQRGIAFGQNGDIVSAIAAFDEVGAHYGNDERIELQIQAAFALLIKGVSLRLNGNTVAAITAYDEFIARYGVDQRSEFQKLVAKALRNKGVALGLIGDTTAEIATYDELIARYGKDERPELWEDVAKALRNKGIALSQKGEKTAAIAAYDELIERYREDERAELQEQVAKALLSKGVALRQNGQMAGAIATYDELIARYVNEERSELREQVAKALTNKGIAYGQNGETVNEIGIYDELISRYGEDEQPKLRELVAKALRNKGDALSRIGDTTAEVAAYDELVARYGKDDQPEVRVQVAEALFNKGYALRQNGDLAGAIATCDELIANYHDDERPELRELVAKALAYKGVAYGQNGETVAEIAAYDELIARYCDDDRPELRELVAGVLFNKAFVLGFNGDTTGAIAAYERALDRISGEKGLDTELVQSIQVRLANLLLDLGQDIARAEALYKAASTRIPLLANANLAWLYILNNRLSEASAIRENLRELPSGGAGLLDAGLELAQENFGSATTHLAAVLEKDLVQEGWDFADDFERLLKLAERKGFGERLLIWMEETGFADRVAPIYAAFSAYIRGEQYLLDSNPEVRRPAQTIYDRLTLSRRHENAAPKKRNASRGRPRKR
ncbi:tetratricopeptide repeat protein [Rhizobium alvei]|uniref:Tetratricopeptide repeat protein n=1 Tax=Rhizobium alvei TaxID=1132659 RepID=A0ABT8YI05_9HYPH|nr:tetratricopeptide repeat protein [Rhizobium alvei]MDO6962948.1 tetratricopeptide repeat protein [Rhizobium alvei]